MFNKNIRPSKKKTMPNTITITADHIKTGDQLLQMGPVGYSHVANQNQPPTIVALLNTTLNNTNTDDPNVEVITSAGTFYTHKDTPTIVVRTTIPTPRTVIVVSKRSTFHQFLCSLGIPAVRRNPVTGTPETPAVSPEEWINSPLTILDGYLSMQSITELLERPTFSTNNQTVMVNTNPNDPLLNQKHELSHATHLLVVPRDLETLVGLSNRAAQFSLNPPIPVP